MFIYTLNWQKLRTVSLIPSFPAGHKGIGRR